jgi:hypothetical protein
MNHSLLKRKMRGSGRGNSWFLNRFEQQAILLGGSVYTLEMSVNLLLLNGSN